MSLMKFLIIGVNRRYLPDKLLDVRRRSSDNKKIQADLNWAPSITLKDGLKKTYKWIENHIKLGENTSKFTRS